MIRLPTLRCNSTNAFTSWKQTELIRQHSRSFGLQFRSKHELFWPSTKILYDGILEGNRASLAKAITLLESSRDDHQSQAKYLVNEIIKYQKNNMTQNNTFRIGVSGPPGVGKSTFIEALGSFLIANYNYKVAVLAVDPSSTRTGGSILGDVTRMHELARNPSAYVRGSPSRGTLGGVTRTTSEAITLCEATGYQIVLVETVGVGQSETAVESMTDMFLMLSPPAGGDELQGIKKGIMELVDLVIINKADGDLVSIAQQAEGEFSSALNLTQPKNDFWTPQVKVCSALRKTNIDVVWNVMNQFWETAKESGSLENRRREQRSTWLWRLIQESLLKRFSEDETIRNLLPAIVNEVEDGEVSAGAAADRLLEEFEVNRNRGTGEGAEAE
mmetsp:Transcript_5853/g.8191  ORF Transcript_5853/g.8191 Transcript_5853/m.8191 type:complete len:387 (-) Transcript_5853:141-1301(-)